MIAKITKAYVRHYSDNGQTVAYVEWVDGKGQTGRTEAHPYMHTRRHGCPWIFTFGTHMHALFARAKREGLRLQREAW